MELAHKLVEPCLEACYVAPYTQVQERRNKQQAMQSMSRNHLSQM